MLAWVVMVLKVIVADLPSHWVFLLGEQLSKTVMLRGLNTVFWVQAWCFHGNTIPCGIDFCNVTMKYGPIPINLQECQQAHQWDNKGFWVSKGNWSYFSHFFVFGPEAQKPTYLVPWGLSVRHGRWRKKLRCVEHPVGPSTVLGDLY